MTNTEEFLPPDLSAYMNQLENDICQLNTQMGKTNIEHPFIFKQNSDSIDLTDVAPVSKITTNRLLVNISTDFELSKNDDYSPAKNNSAQIEDRMIRMEEK